MKEKLVKFNFFSILQCDFFVLNKDTEECHIGKRMGATSTLSDETDKRPAYVDVGKIYNYPRTSVSMDGTLPRVSFFHMLRKLFSHFFSKKYCVNKGAGVFESLLKYKRIDVPL